MLQKKSLNNIFTVSNVLTGSRIVLTPLIVFSLLRHAWGSALVLFCLAGISDLLDGFMARLLNEPTWLGAVLDPIADKFLVVCSLGAFFISSPDVLLPSWFVMTIAMREAILMFGGILLYIRRPRLQIEPSWFGKITTCLVLLLVILVLTGATFNLQLCGWVSLLMSMVLICGAISFMQYLLRGVQYLRSN